MIKLLFYSLILSYPFIALLPKGNSASELWGALSIVMIGLLVLKHLSSNEYKKTNFFEFAALILLIPMLISVFMSNEITLLKFIVLLKYLTPLLFGAIAFQIVPINETSIRYFYRLSGFFVLICFSLVLYRLSLVDFNPLELILKRDFIWYEKSHIIAQLYAAVGIMFFYFAMIKRKHTLLKYIVFLPIFTMGVRSVILGLLMFISINAYTALSKKIKLLLLLISLVCGLLFIQNLDLSVVQQFTSSEQDIVKENQNVTLETFSSGRTIIIDYYMTTFEGINLFFGTGMQYLESFTEFQFRLHNDFLEFFFSFGLFGLSMMIFAIWYSVIFKLYNAVAKDEKGFMIGFISYFFVVSFTNGILDYQSTLYLFVMLAFIYKLRKVEILHSSIVSHNIEKNIF